MGTGKKCKGLGCGAGIAYVVLQINEHLFQVANNLLINRLYPPAYDSDSSESEVSESEDEEEETEKSLSEKHSDQELKEVVVKDDHSLADVASIANTLNARRSSQGSTSTRETAAKGNTLEIGISNSLLFLDNVSRISVKARKKEKKHKPNRLRQMNPFFNYNVGTLRAIQMIETAKLRTDRNPNFK